MGDSSLYFNDFVCEFGWDCNVKGGNFDHLKGFWDVCEDLSYAFGGYLFVILVVSMTSVFDRIIEKSKQTKSFYLGPYIFNKITHAKKKRKEKSLKKHPSPQNNHRNHQY